jgi:cobalt-zinc-cadmium efflux system outer membrane protein
MMALLVILLQGPDSLTAQAAVNRALTTRGQVRASAAAVDRARAGARIAGQIPNPTAGYSYTDDTPRQHFAVQQSFDWLLVRGAAVSAANSSVQAALADSAITAAEIAATTFTAFYRALGAENALVLLSQQLLIADSLSAIARERLRHGDISELEAEQLGLEASRSRQALSRGREDRAAALTQLRRLLVWPETDSLPPLSGDLDAGIDLVTVAALPEVQVPSVRTRLADSVAAGLRHKSAILGRFPVPALEVGIDWDDPTQQGKKLWLFGVSVPIPLWNLSGAQVASARADQDEATALLAEARAELRGRLAETRIRIEEARYRARVDRDSLLPIAQRIRERTARGYQLGETGVIPLLDALRVEREIAISMVDDLMAFQEARATWSSLLGVTP